MLVDRGAGTWRSACSTRTAPPRAGASSPISRPTAPSTPRPFATRAALDARARSRARSAPAIVIPPDFERDARSDARGGRRPRSRCSTTAARRCSPATPRAFLRSHRRRDRRARSSPRRPGAAAGRRGRDATRSSTRRSTARRSWSSGTFGFVLSFLTDAHHRGVDRERAPDRHVRAAPGHARDLGRDPPRQDPAARRRVRVRRRADGAASPGFVLGVWPQGSVALLRRRVVVLRADLAGARAHLLGHLGDRGRGGAEDASCSASRSCS